MISTQPKSTTSSVAPSASTAIPANPPLAQFEKLVPQTPYALIHELCCDLLKLGMLALILSMGASALGALGLF